MKVTSTFCELNICCYNSLKSLRSVKRCLHHWNTKLFYCGYRRYFSILSSLSKFFLIVFLGHFPPVSHTTYKYFSYLLHEPCLLLNSRNFKSLIFILDLRLSVILSCIPTNYSSCSSS
jgi:hypothetical protein